MKRDARGWIRVEDGLPEKGQVVLCYDSETEWLHAVTFRLEGPNEVDFWRNDEGRSIWGVTHWQPLPELPEYPGEP